MHDENDNDEDNDDDSQSSDSRGGCGGKDLRIDGSTARIQMEMQSFFYSFVRFKCVNEPCLFDVLGTICERDYQ